MHTTRLLLDHVNADDLPHWPVTWGAAAPQGAWLNVDDLVLAGPDGATYPVQTRVLRRHADGSVHRFIVTAEPAVPADSHLAFELRQGKAEPPDDPPATATTDAVTGAAGTLAILNDALTLQAADRDDCMTGKNI